MRCAVMWADGSATVGPSATAVLQQIADLQFNEEDRVNIRAALAWRCHVLYGEAPDISVDDEEFLWQCAEIGLFGVAIIT